MRSLDYSLQFSDIKRFVTNIIHDFQLHYLTNYAEFEEKNRDNPNIDIEAAFLVEYCESYTSILLGIAYKNCKYINK